MFWQKRVPMPRVPTDEVIPAHPFDEKKGIRNIIMGCSFRFNDRLDCDKVHEALARLLEIGDWRKLGGRLRLNTEGKMEIHIPQKFTKERPAVRYTHVTYNINIDEHPLAPHLPRITDGPSAQSSFYELRDLCEPDRAINSFDDYIYSDHPQMSLHAVSFNDATLLTLKWPHSMTDGMGRNAIFGNWTRVLAGDEDKVQPLHGFTPKDDVMPQIADLDRAANPIPLEPSVGGQKMLSGFGMFLFILHFIWAIFFGPKMVARIVFLPAKTMEALKDEARRDMQADSADPTAEPPFVSEGDIITAWTARMTISHLAPTTTREVAIMNVVDMRGRIPSIFGEKQPSPTGPVWIQNLAIPAWTNIPIKTLLANPLGRTALWIRNSLLEQSKPDEMARQVRYIWDLDTSSSNGAALFVKPNAMLFPISNWHRVRMFEVFDVTPAILPPLGAKEKVNGHGQRTDNWPKETKRGKPVSIVSAVFSHNPEMRNAFGVIGRDAGGNYWMQGLCAQKCWDNIEKEFARLKGIQE